MIILDGNKLSEKILSGLKKGIENRNLHLKLAVVLVGNNSVSSSYMSEKQKACKKAGIGFMLLNFKEDVGENDLKKEIENLTNDKSVSGIVIQLPLPKNFNTQEMLDIIPFSKDPDVLSDNSFEKFSKKETDVFPPVLSAVRKFFNEYKIDIKGKKIVLIGKGRLVGKPIAVWLKNENADFEVIDKSVSDIASAVLSADIIVSGAGSPGLIKEEMVKEGVILIDAGTSSEDGKVKGDIDISAYKKASYVSPVPGGVGPLAVACLLENLVKLNTE